MKKNLTILLLACSMGIQAQEITIGNNRIRRTLSFEGRVWRTVQFSNNKGDEIIKLKSEEFNILPLNSDSSLSITDFEAVEQPGLYEHGDTSFLTIRYRPLPEKMNYNAAPQLLIINYFAVKDQDFIRKNILLSYNRFTTVDRLEVERFIVNEKATGGGRGEPVFVNHRWFFGLEYPAGYSRHTNGNTPQAYGRYYEKAGNYSFIDLEGGDIEPNAVKGMLRLMHFPGYAVQNPDGHFIINSKTAVAGSAIKAQNAEQAFMQYLSTIWKAPRSFLHYNNWFEPKAKDLSGDGLMNIWHAFKTAIEPYAIKMDAMVVDDGWQNRKSIWDPSTKYFPNGFKEVKALSQKLKDAGVGFGLWLSLNGYTNNIDWGVEQGYREAKPNAYFSRFRKHYSLSAEKYRHEVLQKVPYIIKETDAIYYKHDFNTLSDTGDGNGHPPTDRHGHEATLDAAIEILQATRKAEPAIYQNLTNWIWFSPWWLMYADYLWMLAGDDGTNGNWPELSTRAMATTDRDTYIWRMFGNPGDHPLIPISRLMTHGIIKTSTGRLESKEDNLQDWMDYVVMHYGRGTLLKEWYISPDTMLADQWKTLCTVHNWAARHQQELNNTVFVGGRPDEGNAYGYIGWNGEKGVLVARNTRAQPQKLVVAFNESVRFSGTFNEPYHASVVYPYQDAWPLTFISGKTIEIELPGYATMAFELEKGKAHKNMARPEKLRFISHTNKEHPYTTVTIPAGIKHRYDLLVIGHPSFPVITINGDTAVAYRTSKAMINKFASYAKAGMSSDKAQDWNMIAIDLLKYAGKTITIGYGRVQGFEAWLLAEIPVNVPPAKATNNNIWALRNTTRRQTAKVF
jgi:hypothetical protein